MIDDTEIFHGLINAIDLMESKEYRGAKKLITTIKNKVEKKVIEQKREQSRKLAKLEEDAKIKSDKTLD